MSISDKLIALQTDITDARAIIVAKGGSVTSGGGSSQLATDINTIGVGDYITIASFAPTLTQGSDGDLWLVVVEE